MGQDEVKRALDLMLSAGAAGVHSSKIEQALAPTITLYETNPDAKALLDCLVARGAKLDDDALMRDELVRQMFDVDVLAGEKAWDRQKTIDLLRQFENCQCGRFVTGRRGHRSRFKWYLPAVEFARVVIDAATRKAPAEATGAEIKFVEHPIWLRLGVQVTVRLPEDTTQEEAEKVAGVVRNLWFVPKGTH